MDDGVVIGGVELEVDVPGSDALSMRRFFWSWDGVGCSSLYDHAALQAICFLQGLYGFVVLDYNYKSMMTYRELARSAVVLAASLVRSSVPVVGGDGSAAVGDVNAASRALSEFRAFWPSDQILDAITSVGSRSGKIWAAGSSPRHCRNEQVHSRLKISCHRL